MQKHNGYVKDKVYSQIFEKYIFDYIQGTEINVVMTYTTFIPNKRCKFNGRNEFYKFKNGLKISTLLDDIL